MEQINSGFIKPKLEIIRKPEDRVIKTFFHGSMEPIENFSPEKVGSNIGLGAEGWGFYFTTSEKIAKKYGRVVNKVDLEIGKSDDVFLKWDKILTLNQQELISNKLKESNKSVDKIEKLNGEGVYWTLADILGGAKEASKFLFNLGIDGVKSGEITTVFDENLIKNIKN